MNRKERKKMARLRRQQKVERRRKRSSRKRSSHAGPLWAMKEKFVMPEPIEPLPDLHPLPDPETVFEPYHDEYEYFNFDPPFIPPPEQVPAVEILPLHPVIGIENPMPNVPQLDPGVLDDLGVQNKKVSKQNTGEDQEELAKEVQAVQAAVAEGLARQCKDSAHEIAKRDEFVIQKVREAKLEDLIPVMGDLMATRLKHFCENVDLDHPTIQELMARGFQTDSEFNSTLREIMTLLSMENTGSMSSVLGLLKESFTKAKSMKEVRVAIYKPPTRALKGRKEREDARSKKSVKDIGLKEWLEKAKNWHDHPGSFVCFTRLNDSYQDQMTLNEKRAEKLDELGMTALGGSFRKRNAIITNFLGEQYCGFTKLRMIDAAIILAKVHNAYFKEDYRSIIYSRRAFSKFKFWLEPGTVYLAKQAGPGSDPSKDHKITVGACMIPDIFAFKPRAYPLHEFAVEWPQHVKDVIEVVEAHPDMLGKAIFDQFWVIVPGIALSPEMHHYAQKWWVVRTGDTAELYLAQEHAERALDFHLTRAGCLYPVLVGEKDGKCHFLTYWG
jgi:hypothetical protein